MNECGARCSAITNIRAVVLMARPQALMCGGAQPLV
jgi:hypothetical protein